MECFQNNITRIDEKQLRVILRYADQLQSLDVLVMIQNEKIMASTKQARELFAKIKELQSEMKEFTIFHQQHQSELLNITYKLEIKSNLLKVTEDSIDSLAKGEEYLKIKEIIEQTANSILDNKPDLLEASIAKVLIALRNDPNKSELITDFNYSENGEFQFRNADNFRDSINDPCFRNYIHTHYKSICHTAVLLYEKILIIIQNQIEPIDFRKQDN